MPSSPVSALLSTTYFGPVEWYQKLCFHDRCLLEQWETFQKQTYRNRCIIATTQGRQVLSVPVEHSREHDNPHPPIKELRISSHGNWRHLHWNALQSAYGESPFFDFYADDLRPFFERQWTFLYDFNEAIIHTMCQLLDIHPLLEATTRYLPAEEAAADPLVADWRQSISPKQPAPNPDFQPRPYWQVYQDKHGFLPNLSILDLLFNMGNEAIFFLLPDEQLPTARQRR